jgi:nucleoside-diphosphate-sugar epimerase
MNRIIVVTGINGRLGSCVFSCLKERGFEVVGFSHNMSLDEINWDAVDTVINCSATTPAPNVSKEMYFNGNVRFLENLISRVNNVHFVHFSSLSELYRDSLYQRTKMLGVSLLIANSARFDKLSILPLPTLDSEDLVNRIIAAAKNGDKPVVDQLVYNAMDYDDVADYVLNLLLGLDEGFITSRYRTRNLLNDVLGRVSQDSVIIGQKIDRTLTSDGIYSSLLCDENFELND